MPEDRNRHDVLARITDNPQLARAVPLLRPDVLHAVIAHCGLHECAELIALVTPPQLSAVFDLDLWQSARAGAEEQFDAARFCEWLDVLLDAGPDIAAARLASMDVALVVAGVSPHVTVFDLAVFSPDGAPSGADAVSNAGRERGIHAEIGGYLVVARRQDAWDVIGDVLLALDEYRPDTFHRVMRECRRLSNAGRELDGLDDLLSDGEQARLDLSLGRERRRERLGFLPPEQARAFLDSARRLPLASNPPHESVVFVAYQRSLLGTDTHSVAEPTTVQDDELSAHPWSAVAGVMDVLRGAGVVVDASPRTLLPAAPDESVPVNAALNQYLQHAPEAGDGDRMTRDHELAFLANALVAGCSVQGRAFTRREAVDAVAATCNLGLECWPPQWPAPSTHSLVTVFQVGWTTLQREVSMAAAGRLLEALDMQSSDRELQIELHALRRELRKQRQAGTPWRARARLDVVATLDLPAWAALTALFDECPVMLENVSASNGRRPHSVNPSEFQFISHARHIDAVHQFLMSLTRLLTR